MHGLTTHTTEHTTLTSLPQQAIEELQDTRFLGWSIFHGAILGV